MKQENIYLLVCAFLVILIFLGIAKEQTNLFDKACNYCGYEEHTDSYRLDYTTILLECDGKKIITLPEYGNYTNKWGQQTTYKNKLPDCSIK